MSQTQPTQPLPDPAAQWVLSQPAARRPRRRGLSWLIALVIVLALATAAWFVGEWVARDVVTKTIRQQVITQLALPADQQIDVNVEGAVLPQLIGGTLDDLTVASDDVPLGAVTGDVVVHAQGVPVRGDAAARAASATLSLDAAQVQALLATVDQFPATTVELADPDVTVSTQLAVFGVEVPVGVSLTPSASGGDLVLSPTSLRLAGADVSTADLRQRLGGVADGVLKDWSVCIAQYIPAGVSLAGVTVTGSQLVADLDIDGAIVTDAALQQNGSCS